jgi:RNA polymerase sigma factor (sigma-70 family)
MPSPEEVDAVIEKLVREYEGHLRSWLLRRFPVLGDLVGEVINDALLSIWMGLCDGRITVSSRAYLFTAAHLAALDKIEMLSRLSSRELSVSSAEDRYADDPGPGADLAMDLDDAINRLPARQGQVIRLRAAGYSVRETARAAGMSSNTVGPTVTQAKNNLRRRLEGGMTDDR